MKSRTKTLIICCLLTAYAQILLAQTGSLRGKLTDKNNAETLIGATVAIEGTSLGAVTNIDGDYNIEKVPVGTYTIKISFVGYNAESIPGITIKENESTSLNLKMESNTKVLKDAEVISTRITNTENAVLAEMRSSEQIVNGVSSQQIAKTQDRSASEVIKRLPGVTVMEDRFIVIRGLSERYN
ncbi:MAG: carboxypeptidase-like regulatory domain-containing protein [Bacteroidetes bacterium]|nr:carboxypeptidase-like regulatory domain-containing protein [Bacteroidota bacterium]